MEPNLPLDPSLLKRVDELALEFASARPFRHVVIEPFLDPEFCERLLAEFPSFDRDKSLNEMGVGITGPSLCLFGFERFIEPDAISKRVVDRMRAHGR